MIKISEADWQDRILATAAIHGWRYAHFRPAKTAKGWRTPVQGCAGVPDLLLARGGIVIHAELKTDTGRPTRDQTAWLAELGPHGRLWRPRDWDHVLNELAHPLETK